MQLIEQKLQTTTRLPPTTVNGLPDRARRQHLNLKRQSETPSHKIKQLLRMLSHGVFNL